MQTPGQRWDNGGTRGDESTANMASYVFPLERVSVNVMEVGPFSSPVFHVRAHFTKGHSDE